MDNSVSYDPVPTNCGNNNRGQDEGRFSFKQLVGGLRVRSGLVLSIVVGLLVTILVVMLNGSDSSSDASSVLLLPSDLSGKNVLGQAASGNDNGDEGTDRSEAEGTTVRISRLGRVKGYVLQSREGRDYDAFYKVPYTQPPLNNLRFKSPVPVRRWRGVRDEKEVAPQCIQKSKYSPIVEAVGDEDCLYMNIYRPKLPERSKEDLMPTLFYIHGGGFIYGNGSRYGASYFMDEDAVLVTFQYRLGPFGFLSTRDDEVAGNMGFKDQIMALRWVRDHIIDFGGDPKRVMIFGNSAGGMSVSNLMISPMANGLFQTAITQSGGAFCSAQYGIPDSNKTLEGLAHQVGCPTEDKAVLLECLRRLDAKHLAVARSPDIEYGLIIEDHETSNTDDIFMPEAPRDLLREVRVNKVPWIVGINSDEFVHSAMGYIADPELLKSFNNNWTEPASDLFNIDDLEVSYAIKAFYFRNSAIGNETFKNLSNLLSDRAMVHCSKAQADLQSNYSDVYMYYITKKPAKSYASKFNYPPESYGVVHADELQFLFNYYGYPEYPVESKYYPFSRFLIRTWVQFAATGKPYTSFWQTITPQQRPLQLFELNEIPHPTTVLQKRIDFWDQYTLEQLNYT